jgi:hypothetical protein
MGRFRTINMHNGRPVGCEMRHYSRFPPFLYLAIWPEESSCFSSHGVSVGRCESIVVAAVSPGAPHRTSRCCARMQCEVTYSRTSKGTFSGNRNTRLIDSFASCAGVGWDPVRRVSRHRPRSCPAERVHVQGVASDTGPPDACSRICRAAVWDSVLPGTARPRVQ